MTAEILLAQSLAATDHLVDDRDLRLRQALEDRGADGARNVRTLADACSLREHLLGVEGILRNKLREAFPDPKGENGTLHLAVERFASRIALLPGYEPDRDGGPLPDICQLFQFAIENVQQAYGDAELPVEAVGLTVRLHISGANHLPDVLATTVFGKPDAIRSRQADINIELSRETFDAKQFFGLLVKLHHELFVHSVQALRHDGRREIYGEQCPIAEGLVDRAAFHSLKATLERGVLPPVIADACHRFVARSEELHVLRFQEPPRNGPIAKLLTWHARDAGRRLFDMLVRLRGGGPPAIEWASEVAMRLNLADFTGRQRRELVVRLQALLGSAAATRLRALAALDLILEEDRDVQVFQSLMEVI